MSDVCRQRLKNDSRNFLVAEENDSLSFWEGRKDFRNSSEERKGLASFSVAKSVFPNFLAESEIRAHLF